MNKTYSYYKLYITNKPMSKKTIKRKTGMSQSYLNNIYIPLYSPFLQALNVLFRNVA